MGGLSGPERLVVCVPDETLGGSLDRSGAEIVVWDGNGAPPEGATRSVFLVPPHRVEPLSRAQLDRMPDLRTVQLLSLGVDHWAGSVPADVTLCDGGDLFAASTAELALGGILHLLHEVPEIMKRQRAHVWERRTRRDLASTSVLIVGAGSVGKRLRDALELFGATVVLVGRTARDGVESVARLGELVPHHDVVVLAVPLTPDTVRLVDHDFLRAMPDGGILVNVGRGRVVDHDALVPELSSGRLRAMLDVVDPEPLPAGHPLWVTPGLLLTPHMGGETTGWKVRAARLVADQVHRVQSGVALRHVVPHP